MYKFDQELQEGILIRRTSRFTMDVLMDGTVIKCHCPTTGRIGNMDLKNIACLTSYSDDVKQKLPYTVEAISCDELDKNWVGINQILSNKLVEYFLINHELDILISNFCEIKREVRLGNSKLDFLVGNSYIEVKPHQKSTHYYEVYTAMKQAIAKGVETWSVNFKFTPKGMYLLNC